MLRVYLSLKNFTESICLQMFN